MIEGKHTNAAASVRGARAVGKLPQRFRGVTRGISLEDHAVVEVSFVVRPHHASANGGAVAERRADPAASGNAQPDGAFVVP
jgi:hypothetical protein